VRNKIDTYNKSSRILWWILLAAVVTIAILIRVRLLGFPLERDEGEYAYSGQLMLQGISPYKLAYSMKFPGTAAAYAMFMSIFGQTIVAVHLGLLVVNLITVALLFFLGRRLLNEIGGIVAAATYAVLSMMPYVLGLAAHATHFVVAPVIGGALLLVRSLDRQSRKVLFASGALLGVALLMKQPGFLFILFGAVYLLFRDWQARLDSRTILLRNTAFFCGALLPLALTCFLLWLAGVFTKFWFWTVEYAQQYNSQVSVSQGLQIFVEWMPSVMGAAWPVWVIAVAGLIACALSKRSRAAGGFLIGFLFFSGLALSLGLHFRPHYFVLLLPAISLMAGAAVMSAVNFLSAHSRVLRLSPILLFGIALGWPIWTERDFFFPGSLVESVRMAYGTNPLRESVKIGEYLRAQTVATDSIAVLGSEPQIYFYAQRHSATGYIYTYPLMEPQRFAHRMQLEMIHEIEAANPKYLVLVVLNKSWLAGSDSEQLIFKWVDEYCDQNYEEVGLVNISEQGTDYYFSAVSKGVKPTAEHILIYKRKT
jgi:4-amino-4-deoxy-L-arabinose transferase-like glycosyltransferase